MGELFSITLVSGIILLCLYLPYKLLLARERQHRFNRVVILGIYLTAVVVPLLRRMPFPAEEVVGGSVETAVGNISIGLLTGGMIESAAPVWMRVVLWIYIVGVVVTMLRFLWSYIRLVHIIRTGRKDQRNGYTLVIVDNAGISPFSWRRYIVVGKGDDADESGAVMVHELRHLAACHSMDIFIAQLYAMFVWYNPVSWLMIDELKTVHEYEADEAVVESGANLKEYQMLLIKKTAGARLPSLANSLNHSNLQKRITMMYQSKTRLAGKIGALALLPALAIGVAVLSVPAVASIITDASGATLVESTRKVSKNLENRETAVESLSLYADAASTSEGEVQSDNRVMEAAETSEPSSVEMAPSAEPEAAPQPVEEKPEEIYVAVEKQAEFPGGTPALMRWLSMNIRYPEDAHKNNVQGRVIVKFVINTDGSISDATVIKKVSPSLDNESVRVIMAMPKWEPAENNGKKVASYYNLPITFKLTGPEPQDSTATDNSPVKCVRPE